MIFKQTNKNRIMKNTKINLFKYTLKDNFLKTTSKFNYLRYVYCHNNKRYATNAFVCIEQNLPYKNELENFFIDKDENIVYLSETTSDPKEKYNEIIPLMFDDSIQPIIKFSIDKQIIETTINNIKNELKENYDCMFNICGYNFSGRYFLTFLQVLKDCKVVDTELEIIKYYEQSYLIRFKQNDIQVVVLNCFDTINKDIASLFPHIIN